MTVNIEHYENLVGVLTVDLCHQIFRAGDKLMSILEEFGVGVEYGDDAGELYPGNSYWITREEGYLEEYEDDTPPEEFTTEHEYHVDIDRGVATRLYDVNSSDWPIQPWLLSLIKQHNTFHIRAYGPANVVNQHLGEGETAVKYLDGDEWGYEVFKAGQPVRRLPEGREPL